jgi:HAD superfamily phosphatase (TIGR01668 family)
MREINIASQPKWLQRFTPNFLAESVSRIDFKKLADQGIKAVAFDADSTLVVYKGIEIAPELREYIVAARNHGFFSKVCIATNRRSKNLNLLAESLDASIVQASSLLNGKPKSAYFKRLLTELEVKPAECVMIGDKVFTDIWGANRVGILTILVEKFGPESLLDRILPLRKIEKWFLRRYWLKK